MNFLDNKIILLISNFCPYRSEYYLNIMHKQFYSLSDKHKTEELRIQMDSAKSLPFTVSRKFCCNEEKYSTDEDWFFD